MHFKTDAKCRGRGRNTFITVDLFVRHALGEPWIWTGQHRLAPREYREFRARFQALHLGGPNPRTDAEAIAAAGLKPSAEAPRP